MIAVDASVIADALTGSGERGKKARAAVRNDPVWVAPGHLKIELASSIRGLLLGRKIAEDTATRAVDRIPRLHVDYVPVDALLPRIWQLRTNVSAYDAAYVAIAEARKVKLVTADGRLARAVVPYCTVELIT